MNIARFFVKGLSVVVGLIGLGWTVIAPLLLVMVAANYLPVGKPPFERTAMIVTCAALALVAVMGYLLLRRVWKFWRHPDAAEAQAVVRNAFLLLGLMLVGYGRRNGLLPKPLGTQGPVIELACTIGIFLACYLLYRFGLRRPVGQAYAVQVLTADAGVH